MKKLFKNFLFLILSLLVIGQFGKVILIFAEEANEEIVTQDLIVNKIIDGDLSDRDLTIAQKASMLFIVKDKARNVVATNTYDNFVNGSWTISELPIGEYTVSEIGGNIEGYTQIVGYSEDEGKTTIRCDETSNVTVTNTYLRERGELIVNKLITGDLENKDLTDAEKASMKFKVTGPEGFEEEKSYSEFKDGKWVLKDIPIGEYKVVETGGDVEKYTLSVDYSVNAEKAVVKKDARTVVDVTNFYTRDKGNLIIKKLIKGDLTDKDLTKAEKASMKFTVTGPEGFKEEMTYDKFVNGEWKLEYLPTGYYKVVETGADVKEYGLVVNYSINAEKTAVTKGGDVVVNVTNTYTRDKGNLVIKKLITGYLSDEKTKPEDKEAMIFTVTGPDGFNDEKTYAEFENGQWELTDLPIGEYQVEETVDNKTGCKLTTTYSVEDGKTSIKKNETAEITVTNDYTNVIIENVDSVSKKSISGVVMQVLCGKSILYEWVTNGETHELPVDLEPGKLYTLHEKQVPTGYKVADDTQFVINEDGTINTYITTTRVKDGCLIVENTNCQIKEGIINIKILDEYGNYLPDISMSLSGKSESGDSLYSMNWISKDSSKRVILEPGTYTLVELSSQKDYIKPDPITFVLDNDGWLTIDGELVSEIVMNNYPSGFEKLEGYSMTISDSIGLRFHMSFCDYVKEDDMAYIEFTENNKKEIVYLNDAINEYGEYIFECHVSAKDMTIPIRAQLFLSNGTKGKIYTFTVNDYAEYLINHSNEFNQKEIDIVKTMLTYGYYAQQYFKYNINCLPSVFSSELSDVDFKDYQFECVDDNPYIDFIGARLVLSTKPGLKLYFKGDYLPWIDLDEIYDLNCNLDYLEENGYSVIYISNIDDMGMLFTFIEDDFSLKYGIYSYAKQAMDTSNTSLKNLMNAMYAYDQALKN